MTSVENNWSPDRMISRKRNVIFSRIILSNSAIVAVLGIYNFIRDLYLAGIIDLFFLSILYIAYVLNKSGSHKASKSLLLLSGNAGLFFLALNYPKEVGLYMIFLPLIIMPSVLFHNDEKVYRHLLALLPLTCISLFFFVKVDFIPQQEMTPTLVRTSFLINVSCTLLIFAIILFISSNISDETEKLLSDYAHKAQQRSEHLEKANTQMDHFLHRTTHDLRSPLAAVKGLVTIASKETNDPNMLELFGIMTERIDHLHAFCGELIEYSKNSLLELHYEPVDVRSMISGIVESMRFTGGSDKIQFELNVPEKERFFLDKRMITMVLNNLIGNAIKYHCLEQDMPYIQIALEKNSAGKTITISVIDNGRGIEEDHHEKIFDMFFRATSQGSGSGLGLFMVKEAITKMKGEIVLISSPGTGSQFNVTLPWISHPGQKHDTLN